jgi:hypothetical protein
VTWTLLVLPSYDAEIVTTVFVLTAVVVIVNAGEAADPLATVTEAGTEATVGFELVSVT